VTTVVIEVGVECRRDLMLIEHHATASAVAASINCVAE